VGVVSLSQLAVLAATVLAVVGMMPQLWRVWRRSDANGVALTTASAGAVSELGWVYYTVDGSLWSAVPEAVLAAGINVLLAISVRRAGAPRGCAAVATTMWASAIATTVVLGGGARLGALLSMAYAVELAPAGWAVYRNPSPTGVAPTSWIMFGVESVLWCAYGLAEGGQALVALGVTGTVAALAILLRLAAVGSQGAASSAARVSTQWSTMRRRRALSSDSRLASPSPRARSSVAWIASRTPGLLSSAPSNSTATWCASRPMRCSNGAICLRSCTSEAAATQSSRAARNNVPV
jgi:uncharacterized protein with PQ loop repeat